MLRSGDRQITYMRKKYTKPAMVVLVGKIDQITGTMIGKANFYLIFFWNVGICASSVCLFWSNGNQLPPCQFTRINWLLSVGDSSIWKRDNL